MLLIDVSNAFIDTHKTTTTELRLETLLLLLLRYECFSIGDIHYTSNENMDTRLKKLYLSEALIQILSTYLVFTSIVS